MHIIITYRRLLEYIRRHLWLKKAGFGRCEQLIAKTQQIQTRDLRFLCFWFQNIKFQTKESTAQYYFGENRFWQPDLSAFPVGVNRDEVTSCRLSWDVIAVSERRRLESAGSCLALDTWPSAGWGLGRGDAVGRAPPAPLGRALDPLAGSPRSVRLPRRPGPAPLRRRGAPAPRRDGPSLRQPGTAAARREARGEAPAAGGWVAGTARAAAGHTEGGGQRCPRGPAVRGPAAASGAVPPAGAAGRGTGQRGRPRGSAPDGERGAGGRPVGAAGTHRVPAGRPGAEHAAGQCARVPRHPALPPPPQQGHQLVRAVTGHLGPLRGPFGDALEGGHWGGWRLLALWQPLLWHLGGLWHHVLHRLHPPPLHHQPGPVLGHRQPLSLWAQDDTAPCLCHDSHGLGSLHPHLLHPCAATLA